MTPLARLGSVQRAVSLLLEDLATPTSLKVNLLLKYGEWDQIASLRLDPKQYPSNHEGADRFWRDAMAVNLLRKCQDLPTSFDREAVAEESFLTCEQSCFRANKRLYPYLYPGVYPQDQEEGVLQVILAARKAIARILGRCPDLEALEDPSGVSYSPVVGKHGPGSTFGDKGLLNTVPDKMSSSPTLTPDAWPLLFPWIGTMWASACAASGKSPAFVPGNRFTTVPKDAEKDRSIAVEPSINVFFQLGYGRVLRRRLRAAGVDLRNGKDIHGQVAREASKEGHLLTMDLSNASDTICRTLVKLLLPRDWFESLDQLRSKKTLFREKWFLLEKFSSMGNGFTFELETLIFLGLLLGFAQCAGFNPVVGRDVFVFGDDIIIPAEWSKDVIPLFEFFGLSVNRRKTFFDGPFRESCGGDFFLGEAVRPHFLEELPSEPQHLISLANGLRRACSGVASREALVRRAWFGVLDCIPNHIRNLRGPSGLGDLVVHDVESSWNIREEHGIRYVKCWKPVPRTKIRWHNFQPDVILASILLGMPSGVPFGKPWSQVAGFIPRDPVLGFKVDWVPYS
jgi:hypothetical protein